MPYADVEKRRRFQRRYQRAWRRRQVAKINPLRALKIYVCPHYPDFRLMAGVQFENGFFITNDVETQIRIEQSREFLKFVFPISLDLDLVSPVMGDDEND